MQRVLVTVPRQDDSESRDLEVSAAISAGRPADRIVDALQWQVDDDQLSVRYRIEVQPPGHVLGWNESLVGVGRWDRVRRVLRPDARLSGCVCKQLHEARDGSGSLLADSDAVPARQYAWKHVDT